MKHVVANKDVLRTAGASYEENPVITNYKNIMIDMLQISFPGLTTTELAYAVDESISKHIKDTPIVVDNNYKKRQIDMTLLGLAEYLLDRQPIMTSYGVLFNRHGVVPNPLYNMVDGFIVDRKAMKKEMFKYPKGSEEFEKYNLLQLLLNKIGPCISNSALESSLIAGKS